MNVSQLINEIVSEWAYRVNDGMPDAKNPTHLKELGIVLSEMGLTSVKTEIINHLTEADENKFTNPVLNKKITYKNTKGEDAEGVVGDLLRQPKDSPARKAAERMLPPEGTPERDEINKDLGGEGQPKKPEDEKGKDGGQAEKEKQQQAQAMFDPKNDPAMAARLDKEKETQAKLAADAEKQKDASAAKGGPGSGRRPNPKPEDDEESQPTSDEPQATGPEGGPDAEPPTQEPDRPDTTPPTDGETPEEKPKNVDKYGFEKKGSKSLKHPNLFGAGGKFYSTQKNGFPEFEEDENGKLIPIDKESQQDWKTKKLNPLTISLLKREDRKFYQEISDREDVDGNKLDSEVTDNGSMIIGVEHGENNQSTQNLIDKLNELPPDSKIMFVGEGGMSKDTNGTIEFGGEQAEIRDAIKGKFKNSAESSWDENANIADDNSPVFDEVAKSVGGSKSKSKAAIWSNMVGQGDNLKADDYLDDEGKKWIIDQAKKAGATNITDKTDFNNLTDAEKKDLYELNYNDEGKMGDNEIMKGQEAYNNFRQKELDRKIKEAEEQGYRVIAPVGNDHVDMWRKRNRPEQSEQPSSETPTTKPEQPSAEKPEQPKSKYDDAPDGSTKPWQSDKGEQPEKPEQPKSKYDDAPDGSTKPWQSDKGEQPKSKYDDAPDGSTKPWQSDKNKETPSDTEKPEDKKDDKENIKKEKPGQEATSSSGKKIYSVGGGYYSDKPNGPAKYVRTENVVDLAFSDIITEDVFALFEKTISATLSNGKKITVQELPPRAVKKATQKAKAAAASYKEPEQKPQAPKGETPPTDKKVPPQPPIPPKKAATPPPPPPPPKRPAVPPPPPTRKEEPAEPGNPKGEYKPDPKLEPKVDDKGNVEGTDIPAQNEENPNPKFVNKVSTKLDDFYKDVLDEEERAQKAVIEKMKAEGKLPADFKEVHPLPFGFKHPALKDNPELQKEFSAAVKDENKPPHWDLCKVSIPGTNKFCDENIGIPRDKMPQLGGKPKPGSEGEAKAKRIADQNVRKKMGLPNDGEIPADKKQEYDDLYAKENIQHVNVEKEFEDYLKSEGINVSDPVEVPASSLKATQSELVGEQIVGMVNSLEQDPNNPFITAPIMVTRDGYVIDGHHRWATIQAYNMKHTPPNGDKEPIKMKVRVVDEDIETHIPRANAFAEKMGIETMSGKGKKKDEPKPATSTKPSTLSRIKEKLKNWNKKEKEYFNMGYHKPGSDARKTFSERLKDKASGAWKAVKDGFKHEVEEFKTAGSGVKNFFSGKPLSKHEQKALKSVGIKIAVTALTGAAFGGLAHGAAAFAKHVAIEFIPHVVGETILKGAGRAAIFADADGEAEMDAQFVKFAEMIADGLENMKISPEQMEEMIDSYNKKKEEDTMKKEISIIDEIILEILNEKNPIQKANDVLNQTVKNPETNKDIKVSSALKYKGSKKAGQLQAYNAAIKLLKKAGVTDDELGAQKQQPKEIPGQGLGFRKTKEKELEPQTTTKKTSDSEENVEGLYDPNDKLQSSVVSAKNSNELFNALDKLGKDEQDLMLDKVQAGAGGPVASTGETLCTEAQTDLIQGRYNQKEIRNSKEYKDAVKKIDAIIFGDRIDKRAQKALAKELDKICDKMGYYDENGNPDYRLAIAMKAEADVYIQQNLEDFKNTNVARTKFKKEEDMVSWMRASFYSSYSLLNNGPADWDRKKGNGRVMKANSRTDGAVKQVLLNSLKNAKTPEEKAHYENQLKVWEKFKGYHDTYMVYKNDKGFYSVYHISNKKSDELDDPQNNTTPETRLANYMAAAREANLSPKAAKSVNEAQLRALQGSADNDNIAKSAYAEIPEEDITLIASFSGRLPARSQTDVKDEYYTDLKNDKTIKDWYKKKYGDKWETKYKSAKPSEVIGVAMEIAKQTKDISKLSGNFTKFIIKQGQLAQSIFDKVESGMNAKQISESFKGIYSAKEIQAILDSETMKMLADRKAQHAAGLEGVHKGFITSLHKADGTKPGHNGKNGPAVETYVAGTLKSLHIDTYVTNYDDSVQIEMGGVGCTPIDVRSCMASLSGFKGDTTTPEGRAALNKHLAETVKVDADSDAVYLVGEDGKTRTYLASDTWRQAGSSKKIATGFGSNLRKCLAKSVSSRLSKKRNKK